MKNREEARFESLESRREATDSGFVLVLILRLVFKLKKSGRENEWEQRNENVGGASLGAVRLCRLKPLDRRSVGRP